MMRLGLRQFLTEEPDLCICGEAANASAALEMVEKLKPNLVLVDVVLEGPSGLDLLKDLRTRYPHIPVLVHSMHDETVFADRALQAGAGGYLMKQETADKLADAIRQVLRGEIYLSESLRERARKSSRGAKPASVQTPISRLTHRELEVFQMIGKGCANKQVADQLHISIKTVEAHRDHIKRKLNLTSSTALNLLAVRWEYERAQ